MSNPEIMLHQRVLKVEKCNARCAQNSSLIFEMSAEVAVNFEFMIFKNFFKVFCQFN